MLNFVQSGEVLDLDPGATVAAGVGHLFGSVFGVAAVDAVSGTPSSFVVEGVVDIAKTSALAISVGDLLYWDASAKVVNKTAAAQLQVGIAIAAAANPSSTVKMLMRGAAAVAADVVGVLTYITSVAIDTTLGATHYTVLVDATAGAVVITLPTAASALAGGIGRVYNVKKTDVSANTVTVDGNASETIDGATTQVLTAQYQSMTIQSNGTTWSLT
jgi:predicted RecA/RadA family phage recombinase